MKNLNKFLIESNMKPKELENYTKSVITNSFKYNDYIIYLTSAINGFKEGALENIKYYKDIEADDADKFAKLINELMQIIKKAN